MQTKVSGPGLRLVSATLRIEVDRGDLSHIISKGRLVFEIDGVDQGVLKMLMRDCQMPFSLIVENAQMLLPLEIESEQRSDSRKEVRLALDAD